eukprot:TRINITY_DN15424_c0_g1_i5.p1 TRINITY_DN15424_c0_g1~~TRINITY_DN15424_c0_g1_i5.p1  ORF type:complete len:113 (+),score=52.22 TRINITY_DN15424_c0_g1_i5:75-413(+)
MCIRDRQWLAALRGVEAFVDNLNHFDVGSVDAKVIARTVDFLIKEDLRPETVELFSKALSALCEWIWTVCEESVPGVRQEREQAAQEREEGALVEELEEEIEAQGEDVSAES